MPSLNTVALAAIGGILPAILWLFFWLREDRLHPEPKRLIFRTFVFGMASVLVVLPLESFSLNFLSSVEVTGLVLLSWAFIEEAVKYGAAFFGGIHTRADDEPIDPLIYMITTALGFAALENTLFLIDPIAAGSAVTSIVTGNVRFIGATLLHVISSAAIGGALSLSFYKTKGKQYIYRVVGILLATTLHLLFNIFIIRGGESAIISVFLFVWLAVILLLLFFEKIKKLKVNSIT